MEPTSLLPEPGGLPACRPKVAHFTAFDHQVLAMGDALAWLGAPHTTAEWASPLKRRPSC